MTNKKDLKGLSKKELKKVRKGMEKEALKKKETDREIRKIEKLQRRGVTEHIPAQNPEPEFDGKLKELIEVIKKYPHTSSKYQVVRKEIAKKIAKKYPDQFVLATPSKFDPKGRDGITTLREVTSFESLNLIDRKLTFFEDDRFMFVPREEAEYNYRWKQINVFGFITDGTKYALLKKKSDDTITMIGGHVDYSLNAYQTSQLEILRGAMQTELNEEVSHRKRIPVPEKPIALINTFNKFHDLFHMAFIYKIEVDEVTQSFSTGEPEKHDVVIFENKEELVKSLKLHHWIKAVEHYL